MFAIRKQIGEFLILELWLLEAPCVGGLGSVRISPPAGICAWDVDKGQFCGVLRSVVSSVVEIVDATWESRGSAEAGDEDLLGRFAGGRVSASRLSRGRLDIAVDRYCLISRWKRDAERSWTVGFGEVGSESSM